MSIKRFFAKTTSEALRNVREALGPEGVILSNRSMDGGIEILALRQDDIAALIPAPALNESEAKRSEAGRTSLLHMPLLNKEAKPNEKKPNETKYGHELQAFFPASPKDLLNRIKKADIAGKDLHASGIPSRQNGERKRDPDYDIGLDSYLDSDLGSNLGSTTIIASDTFAKEQEEHSRAVEAAQTPIRKSHSVGNSRQPTSNIADQLVCSKAPEVPTPDKRRRNSHSAAAETLSDSTITRKRKTMQTSTVDARQLADEVTASVLKEIKSMRSALEQKFSSLNRNGHACDGSAREHLLNNLLVAGFSGSLAHGLMEQLPDQDGGSNEEDAMKRIRTSLIRNLKTITNEDEILEKGGIYALVGPTGVGKTTTTAKLAARCVVRHGADKLALLTTDGYRIGGHEQLRIYGKILGVTVHAVKDAQDLALALAELRGKHMVLIDTMGVGQRDQMVAEQIAMFAGCGTEVRRLLLLNASSSLHTLHEVAEAYRGDGLAGAIITKLDEAVITGCALDTAIRHRLPLYYVAQGQRVPEDLELADPRHLVNLALDISPASPRSGPADAFPLIMTRSNAASNHLNMDEVYLD